MRDGGGRPDTWPPYPSSEAGKTQHDEAHTTEPTHARGDVLMDLDLIGKTLGGGVVLAVVVWLIYLGFRKDRTGIDAQNDATAVALLKEMREERSAERRETREELGAVRERVAILEEDKRRHADVLQRHALWDTRALALLQQADSSPAVAALGDPPPLYPQGG